MAVNQELRAAKAWLVLVKVASDKGVIRYNELAFQIGMSHHRPLRYVLGYIQDYCLEAKLPPLTILVVNQSNNPGTGFIAWDTDNLLQGYQQVYGHNWGNELNPFNYAFAGYEEDKVVEALLENPCDTIELYSLIKVRGVVQSFFRQALLKAYNYRCALCSFGYIEALEACHIISWKKSSSEQRLDVRNGILLCANHHHLFDNGWLTINEDYSIFYSDMNREYEDYSVSDETHTIKLHGKIIALPSLQKHWPLPEYLLQRKEYK